MEDQSEFIFDDEYLVVDGEIEDVVLDESSEGLCPNCSNTGFRLYEQTIGEIIYPSVLFVKHGDDKVLSKCSCRIVDIL